MLKEDKFKQKIPDIIIVDDVAANLKVLGEILKGEGYRVRPVLSGLQALQAAEKEKPDLIILDVMMPAMNGYEVAGRLRKDPKLNDIPIIFISALSNVPLKSKKVL
ncbi:MAG: response regulator [Mariniphaga sp.]